METSRRRTPEYHRSVEFSADWLEQRADRAETSLRDQLMARPELRQYVDGRTVTQAHATFVNLPGFLRRNPHVLQELQAAHLREPHRVAIMILPHTRLILAYTNEGIVAMTPVLGCTWQAINDLGSEHSYDVVYSTHPQEKLEKFVWNTAKQDPNRILSYQGSGLDPTDYIALGATGMLRNEVLRVPVELLLR